MSLALFTNAVNTVAFFSAGVPVDLELDLDSADDTTTPTLPLAVTVGVAMGIGTDTGLELGLGSGIGLGFETDPPGFHCGAGGKLLHLPTPKCTCLATGTS